MSSPMISLSEAARRASMSTSRLRALCVSGRLPAAKLAGRWALDESDLERWLATRSPASTRPKPGRHLSPRSAWAVLGLGEANLSRSERQRMITRRLDLTADTAVGLLAARAKARPMRCHPGMLDALREDGRLVLTGTSASDRFATGLENPPDRLEAYVGGDALQSLVRDFHLTDATGGVEANAVLRVPQADGIAEELLTAGLPAVVCAVDLLESPDPRAREAGHGLLLWSLDGGLR